MTSTLNKKSVIALFILPAFSVFTVIVVVSIVWVFGVSFLDWNGMTDASFVGFRNYIQLFTEDPNYWEIVGNTIVYTIYELFWQVFCGLLVAIFLTRIRKHRALLQTLYYIPVVISTVAICQIFTKFFSVTPAGLINSLLGLFNEDWLYLEWISNPELSLEVAAFAEGYKYFGLYMITFYAALISIPTELEEAALIDGASTFTQYVRIKIPYIKPVIIANLILVFNGSMRSFDVSYLLTKGGPANTSQLLAPYMYKQAFNSLKYGYGSAVAITIVILCVVLGVVMQKFLLRESED